MNPIMQTRIYMSEHSYPTPTRNHLSMHNREASKRKMYGATRASEVRHGIRKDGVTVMGMTDTEKAQARMDELANLRMEREQRMAAIHEMLNASVAHADTWARKS